MTTSLTRASQLPVQVQVPQMLRRLRLHRITIRTPRRSSPNHCRRRRRRRHRIRMVSARWRCLTSTAAAAPSAPPVVPRRTPEVRKARHRRSCHGKLTFAQDRSSRPSPARMRLPRHTPRATCRPPHRLRCRPPPPPPTISRQPRAARRRHLPLPVCATSPALPLIAPILACQYRPCSAVGKNASRMGRRTRRRRQA